MAVYLLSEMLDVLDDAIDVEDGEMIPLVRERSVKAAIEEYSVDRPQLLTEDVTGNDTPYYALESVLSYWTERVSIVERIQFPAPTLASSEVPVDLSPKDWQDDYWDGATRYLYLPNHSPTSAQTLRVSYRAPYYWAVSAVTTSCVESSHGLQVNDYVVNRNGNWERVASIRTATHQVSAVADANNFTVKILHVDIPSADFYAVCWLASSIACRHMSSRYASMGDTYVGTSLSNMRTKAVEYGRRATEYREMYDDHVGIGEGVRAAGTHVRPGIPEHATLQREWRRPIT